MPECGGIIFGGKNTLGKEFKQTPRLVRGRRWEGGEDPTVINIKGQTQGKKGEWEPL